jgi:hypothetical protein
MENKEILEEINRYRSINEYVSKLLNEQDAPPALPAPPGPADIPPAAPAAGADTTPDIGALPMPTGETEEPPKEPSADDTTEEIDITDLVNMTKSIKKDMDDKTDTQSAAIEKMDGVFNKLSELESKLAEMDNVIQKIDQLSAKIEEIKPKTPIEKLEMKTLDSYPFNQKPIDFFNQKQEEMRASGKNQYVLTKDDVENYSKDLIAKSFNPEEDQEFMPIKF